MKKLFFIAALLVAAGEKALAQGVRLEDSIITETNFETNVLSVAKNVTVITSDEIQERGAKNLGDVLKSVPGINVSTLGGADTVFDLRGQGDTAKSNVLILLDGSPLNTIDLSGYKTSQIDISSVERIEVIPSGGSVLYGDGAIGGVINIITKSPEKKQNYGSVAIEGGSYDYGKVFGTYGTTIGENLLVNGSYSTKNSKGYRDDSKDDLDDFNISGKYLLEDGTISISANRSKTSFNAPDPLNENEWKENDKKSSLVILEGENTEKLYTLNFNKKFTSNFEFLIYGSYAKTEYKSYREAYSSEYDYDTKKLYIKPHTKYNYSINGYLITGFDFLDATTNTTKGFSTGKKDKKSIGGFILNRYHWNNFEFTQGFRRQHIDYTFIESEEFRNKKFKEDAFDLSINYLINDASSIYLTYTTAFRSPNTDEMGDYWDYSYGFNPQTSKTIEIGTKTTLANNYFSASLFKTLTKNEIIYDDYAGFYGANRNLSGETQRLGGEFFAEHYFNKITLRESLSFINTKIKDGEFKGSEIPNVPNILVSLGTTYRITDKLTLNGDLNYTGKSYSAGDFTNKTSKNSSYTTLDISFNYSFTPNLDIYGGIKNITDKKYSDYIVWKEWNQSKNYYPANGRNFYIGAKYNF